MRIAKQFLSGTLFLGSSMAVAADLTPPQFLALCETMGRPAAYCACTMDHVKARATEQKQSEAQTLTSQLDMVKARLGNRVDNGTLDKICIQQRRYFALRDKPQAERALLQHRQQELVEKGKLDQLLFPLDRNLWLLTQNYCETKEKLTAAASPDSDLLPESYSRMAIHRNRGNCQ